MDATAVYRQVEIFVGQTTPAETHVIVRLPPALVADGWSIRGQVVGPACMYSSTLQARIPLRERLSSNSPLSLAVVPDPCFWTPAMPFLYRVEVTLAHRGVELPPVVREIGVRPLATRGKSLLLEGKNWVLRGGHEASVANAVFDDWHDADLAMLVGQPGDKSCAEASNIGVLLIAEIEPRTSSLESELDRLTAHPSVGLIILPFDASITQPAAAIARGAILVQRIAELSAAISPWAQAILCSATDPSALASFAAQSPLPVLVERRLQQPASGPHDARKDCDHLQRDLAGRSHFAGYIV
ncbi:MAG: hypothetical protein AB7U97_27875 [Pirellulales bacterium]